MRYEKGKSLFEFPSSFVVFDIETTGLDPSNDEIIEIGAIKIENNKVTDTFQALIKPSGKISSFITDLTGISNEMVESAEKIDVVLPKFRDFIGNTILVGHNVNFDINFIYDNSVRLDLSPLTNDYVDTLRLARSILPTLVHHRLADLAYFYEIDTKGSHRALKDVEMTLDIYYKLQEESMSNLYLQK